MNCLDEGLLQALLDGELSAEAKREAEVHLASCPACAAAASEAAQEFALFSRAFAVDESLNVPTERLRTNIASAVAEIKTAQETQGFAPRESSDGRVRSFWSSLAAAFVPRQVAVFASLALMAVVLAATFFVLRTGTQPGKGEPQEVASGNTPVRQPDTGTSAANPAPAPTAMESGPRGASGGAAAEEIAKGTAPKPIRPEKAKIRPRGPLMQEVKSTPRPLRPVEKSAVMVADAGRVSKHLLPVEREYVREIAALKTSIELQKSQTLSPTLRAEYERNVAVVDEAIASTRAAVKSNPDDKNAQEFLRAAYQDKLDLLSAVAGKSQLAAVGR